MNKSLQFAVVLILFCVTCRLDLCDAKQQNDNVQHVEDATNDQEVEMTFEILDVRFLLLLFLLL